MNTMPFSGSFENISQRVAFTYLKLLADDCPGNSEQDASRRDLHAFFSAFYETLYHHPERYGLPLKADACIDGSLPEPKDTKTWMNRLIKPAREPIEMGVEFLYQAGQRGRLEGQALVLDGFQLADYFPKPRVGSKFRLGLNDVGLLLSEEDGAAVLTNTDYPAMMPALAALARACARIKDKNLGTFLFTRCDFNALQPGYMPDPLDLYCIFNLPDFERLSDLHAFFTRRNYRPNLDVVASGWVVQYQGNRKIKASPFFQVEYQERYKNPLLVRVKCANASRVAPLLPQYSQALRDDFFARSIPCGNCGWCDNHKGLGPAEIEHDGRRVKICWYVNSDVRVFDDPAMELIEEYAQLHEALPEL